MFSKFTSVSLLVAAGQATGPYVYNLNGENWAQVDALCGSGMEQSPIDLVKWPTEATKNMKVEGFGYMNYDSGLSIVNKGTTL